VIVVRTPLGKLWHLGRHREDLRTFCGLRFSYGFDEVQEYRDSEVSRPNFKDSEICHTCKSVRARRAERGIPG
jgi:hypothetical protein